MNIAAPLQPAKMSSQVLKHASFRRKCASDPFFKWTKSSSGYGGEYNIGGVRGQTGAFVLGAKALSPHKTKR